MDAIPDGSIHCVVTSPPYDEVREYGGNSGFSAQAVIKQLDRVLVDGGSVCWVVQDQTKDFAKSGTSARTTVAFLDSGFRLFETMIYHRHGRPGPWWSQRLRVDHEYIHVFFKGARPRVFNKPMIPAIYAGLEKAVWTERLSDGTTRAGRPLVVAETKCRGTVWKYPPGNTENDFVKLEHPATFPNALASDLIQAFSDEGDIILDPFIGSGTTAVMSDILQRRWCGYEINPNYIDIATRRLSQRSMFSGGAA